MSKGIFLILALACAWSLQAQSSKLFPQLSPEATTSLTIGITPITIEYHRPAVRGRAIWGSLVPYGRVWRTGANEATHIRFGDAVKVNGNPVPAGTYALFSIPGPEQWTLILNRRARQFGSFEYSPQDDQLRFDVKPKAVPLTEWLTYGITPSSRQSAYVDLFWEKLRVSFLVEVDVDALVAARMKKAMARADTSDWKIYSDAAEYLLELDQDLNQSLVWADRSITIQENPTNLHVKARLLYLMGRIPQARQLLDKAARLAKSQRSGPAVLGPIQATLEQWKADQGTAPAAPNSRR
jgi:hypothetical protein